MFISTGGPLSPLYTRWFDADRFWLYLSLHLGLILMVALAIATLAGQHNRFGAAGVLSLGTVSLIDQPRDALFFCIPALTALVVLSQLRSPIEYVAVWAGLTVTAVAALAKFSTVPPAMVGFLVTDGVLVSRRQVPFLTVGFLAIFFRHRCAPCWWKRATCCRLSAAVSPSQPGTRTPWGSRGRRRIAGLCLCVWVPCRWRPWAIAGVRALRDRRTGLLDAAARGLIIGVLVFISFKGGFVRHDLTTRSSPGRALRWRR